MSTQNTSLGANLGTWMQLRYKHLQMALRGEFRMHQNGFLPETFSMNYKVLRDQGIEGEAKLWENLDELSTQNHFWHWGWKFAGHINLYQAFNLRWGFSDSNPFSTQQSPLARNNMELGIMHEGLELGKSDYRIGAYAHYHQRNAKTFAWQLKRQSRDLVFAGMSLQHHSFYVDLQLAKRPLAETNDVTALALVGTNLPF
jgi:hypothetical protein